MSPTILLTRPEPDSAQFAGELARALGPVPIVVSPMISIQLVPPLPDMTGVSGLIFTSRYGVSAYRELGGVARPAYVVGPATGDAARAMGCDVIVGDGDAVALARRIRADNPPGRWLHLRGEHQRGDIAETLRTAGIEAEARVVYRQVARGLSKNALTLLTSDAPVILPLFSPRSAQLLVRAGPFAAPLWIVAMSAAVAEAAAPLSPRECRIARQPDAAAMFEATLDLWRRVAPLEGRGGRK